MRSYLARDNVDAWLVSVQFRDDGLRYDYAHDICSLISICQEEESMYWYGDGQELLDRVTFSCPWSCIV